jgi:hypothetical protein
MKSSMRQGLLVLVSLSAPALFSQSPVHLSAEVAARRIDLAASEVQKIKQLVEAGAEARIKLDDAERKLADVQDEAILAGTPQGETQDVDDLMIAAAQRRVDRETAWIDKLKKLVDLGFMSASELDSHEKELSGRKSDLARAQSNAQFKIEQAALAKKASESSDAKLLKYQDLFPSDMEHYQGIGEFDEARDLKPLAKAFETEFDRPLPISADGETEVHRAMGFDHRGRIDVAVNPGAPEGVWLRQYLRSRQIPYYAFSRAIAGKATAAHIHIGPGSTHLLTPTS